MPRTKKTVSPDFVQYRKTDDWGHVYYVDCFNQRLVVAIGDAVRVRFPDGYEQTLNVHGRHHVTTVSDMGHPYTAESNLLGFTMDCHGVKTWVPIEEVEIATVW